MLSMNLSVILKCKTPCNRDSYLTNYVYIFSQDVEMREKDNTKMQAAASKAAQVDSLINRYTESGATGPVPGLHTGDSGIGGTSSDINRYLNDTGVRVDDIIARYSQRAAAIGSNFIQSASEF